jgi:uncharacterized protein (TIGR00661 family)
LQVLSENKTKTVLIAPLDWGLGHATRCIPIINGLQELGCRVLVAATGSPLALLRQEFPQLEFLSDLPAYNIRYSHSRIQSLVRILAQTPGILKTIRQENLWLRIRCRRGDIHGIISDNRYGFHHPKLPTVFISHQLQVKSPIGRFGEGPLRRWQYQFINRFTECWAPDCAENNALAGDLSHPSELPKTPVYYIGPLSRFEKRTEEKKYSLLVLLSGPEPQRTMLEGKLLSQLQHYEQPVMFVRGLPAEGKHRGLLEPRIASYTNKNIHFENHLPAAALNKVILQSEKIITRSGYTTVMDLLKTGAKMLLVPTPGQTEQEYLARHLNENERAPWMEQKEFDLEKALVMFENFLFKQQPAEDFELYKPVLERWVRELPV